MLGSYTWVFTVLRPKVSISNGVRVVPVSVKQ